MFIKRIAIDLGTTYTLVHLPKKGIVVNEPSVVAVSMTDKKILAVGNEAKDMLGRTPDTIMAIRPLKDGVIADYHTTEIMLRYFINKALGGIHLFRPEVMVAVPASITSTERRAVIDATLAAGARAAYLIKEPVAAAIGANIPVGSASGHMIIDVGGGTAEMAVISLGGIVTATSVRVGGNKIDLSIIEYVRRKYNLAIGERTAEEIKIGVGSALYLTEKLFMKIKGRDILTGLPKIITVSSDDVTEAIQRELEAIVGAAKNILRETPPELAADIMEKGAVLSGGTALLRNLDQLISRTTDVPVIIAEDPWASVVKGTGIALENLDSYKRSILLPSNMIIGIDASRANRAHKTGVEWYAYHIIKNLVEIDPDDDYILYSDKPLEGDLLQLCKVHSNCKQTVLHWPLRYFWTLGRLSWEMIVRPPDVLFVPAHTLPLFSRAKMVNTIHDVAFMVYPQFYSTLDRKYLQWSTRFALSRAEQIITVSNFTKQEIMRYFLMAQEDKISVVYHGYDRELYHPITHQSVDNPVLDYYHLERPYFIYVGRLESKKNIIGLLNAFRNFCQERPQDKTKLVLVGKRSRDYAPINNLLADPIIKERAKELGWVPEKDLPALLRQSLAFIYPSWYEGFGLPIIQAMACGTPVIAARVGSLPEIGSQVALYFDPADQGDLLEKMKQLTDDSALRHQLSQAGLKRAAQFSWSQAAAQTLEILKKSHG